MIISNKQIMLLIANTQTLMAIADATLENQIDIINCTKACQDRLGNLLADIFTQQSEELREIKE